MTGPVVAVGAVVVHHGALLLVRRARPPAAGQWSVPGGRVEPGEAVRAAVAREVAEETGLTVEVGDLAGFVERMDAGPPPYHFVILDFFAAPSGPEPVPVPGDDALEARWVPLDEVPRLDLVDGLLDFLTTIGSVTP